MRLCCLDVSALDLEQITLVLSRSRGKVHSLRDVARPDALSPFFSCAFATLSDFTSIVADFAVATISALAFVIFSSQSELPFCLSLSLVLPRSLLLEALFSFSLFSYTTSGF